MGELLIDAAGALRAAPRQPRRRIVCGRAVSSLDHRNLVTTSHLPGGEPEHVPNDQVRS
jgi:hypothetical protein